MVVSRCSPWQPLVTAPRPEVTPWYRTKFVLPLLQHRETDTRFVPARVGDHRFNNPESFKVLANLTGGLKRA